MPFLALICRYGFGDLPNSSVVARKGRFDKLKE
jgi:hypothetical protein